MAVLTDQERRWLSPLLVLATIAVGFVVLGDIVQITSYFGDILLIFFMAWLLAFVFSPAVTLLDRALPRLPRQVAVVIVYALLIAMVVSATILLGNALASSLRDLLGNIPGLSDRLPEILGPWQRWLDGLGLGRVNLVAQANTLLANLSTYASQAIGPLQEFAAASLGLLGNVLMVVILSVYMVLDGDRILSFLSRLVPPRWQGEAALFEQSVAESFGGFLRGQIVMGVVYFAVALVANGAGGLDYAIATSVASGVLQAIPVFGPYVSWAPPVLVAALFAPQSVPIVLAVMLIGWFVVMNVLQPRLMAKAVGIHPIVVLASVLIGGRVAGITGATFGIPVAAVLSTFFFHALGRTGHTGGESVPPARRPTPRQVPGVEQRGAPGRRRNRPDRRMKPHPGAGQALGRLQRSRPTR